MATIALARPDVHNAFNETLIAELTRALRAADADDAVRVVVLAGRGRSFCAGADLNWMKRMAAYGHAENLADASALAAMLATLAGLSKPTVARVHGAAFGGGVGLVAACDIAIAAQDATFALSEAKLGLIPATISPYVMRGDRRARGAALLPHRRALRRGRGAAPRPVHEVVPADALDARIDELTAALLLAGPQAQAAAKALIARGRAPPDRCRRRRRHRGAHRGGARVGRGARGGGRLPRQAQPGVGAGAGAQVNDVPGLDRLDLWQLVALAAALGWASGIRLYAVLFVVGGLGYFHLVELPHGLALLAHPWVLAASGFMCFVEFFADKIPGVDSAWDVVHTFIRIPAGPRWPLACSATSRVRRCWRRRSSAARSPPAATSPSPARAR